MRWIPLPLALPLILAATSGLAADSPLRPELLREAMALKLGAWQTRSTLVEIDVKPGPDDDPAEVERETTAMRAQLARGLTMDQCLWDDRSRLNLPGVRAPGNCDFSRLEARDGRFAVAGICKSPDSSAAIQVAIDGGYSPERMTYRSEATTSGNGARIRIMMDMVSRFAGECAALPVIRTPSAKGR